MVVAQDACLRINRGWYSRMGNLFGTSANETVPANGVKKEVPANGVKKEVPANGVKKEVPANEVNGQVNGVNGVNEVNEQANEAATPTVTPGTAGGKRKGGYRPTKKDKAALKKLKQGKSIGFTMRSSLKAKGLLRRANGTMRVSAKYKKN